MYKAYPHTYTSSSSQQPWNSNTFPAKDPSPCTLTAIYTVYVQNKAYLIIVQQGKKEVNPYPPPLNWMFSLSQWYCDIYNSKQPRIQGQCFLTLHTCKARRSWSSFFEDWLRTLRSGQGVHSRIYLCKMQRHQLWNQSAKKNVLQHILWKCELCHRQRHWQSDMHGN